MARKRPRGSSMDAFAAQTRAIAEAAHVHAERVVREAVIDGYEFLLRASPVLTGRYRGSWNVSKGVPDESVIPFDEDVASAGVEFYQTPNTNEKLAVLDAWSLGEELWFNNSLPYAEALEDGWSQKGTGGAMAKLTRQVIAARLIGLGRSIKLDEDPR